MLLENVPNLYQVSEVQLIYKHVVSPHDRINVSNSADCFQIFNNAWDHNRIDLIEQFKILLVKGNYCIGLSDISTGGAALCPVDPKIVFATALKANAAGIIMAHNHPSGNPQPSAADIALTERLCRAGKLLDVFVMDHLIITSQGYLSLADQGLMPV